MFEYGLVALLELYIPKATAAFLYDNKPNEQRIRTIRHFAQQNEKDPALLELIEHLLLFFGRCHENRNIVMHSSRHFESYYPSLLSLEKKPKGTGPLNTFHLSLPALRRLADEMMDGVFLIADIWRVVNFRDHPPPAQPLAPPSLPKKPPLPHILNPSELTEAILTSQRQQ
jgi:hypothetical protein